MESNPKPLDRQFAEARARRPKWSDGIWGGTTFGLTMAVFTIGNDLYERAGLGLQPPAFTIGGPLTYVRLLLYDVAWGVISGVVVVGMIRLWRRFWLLVT